MSCPTCGHTLQRVGADGSSAVFWCPRCGTIRAVHGSRLFVDDEAPALVGRVRRYMAEVGAGGPGTLFRTLGLDESVYTPEARA